MIEVSIHYPIARRTDEASVDRARIEFVLPKHPFLFWSSRLHEAEAITYPRGYGLAYFDTIRARYLFALMPFNILVGAAIWMHGWLRFGFARWCWEHRVSKKGVKND